MRVEQLRSFVAVYEEASFTGAAKRLQTEQPVITKHISQIERELGCNLFHRTTRSVLPTAEGDAYYAKISKALVLIDEAAADVRFLSSKDKSTIRVGYNYLYMDYVTTRWLEEFSSRCDDEIVIDISEASFSTLMSQIINGSIDAAFVGVTDLALIPAFLEVMSITKMGEKIVLNKKNALASKKELSIEDLLGEEFIYPAQSPTSSCSIVMKEFEEQGKSMRFSRTEYESSVLRIVGSSNAILDIPELCPVDDDNVVTVPYKSNHSIEYCFVWNRGNLGEAFKKLVAYIDGQRMHYRGHIA